VYWATALRMFADAPLLGLGPGNWTARRIAYTQPGELDFTIPHAHDQVLETGAEFGLLGLAAGAVALACVAWLCLRALRGHDRVRRRWAWATVFALLYLAIATVVDSYTYPAILLPLAIPVAYLDATSERSVGLPRALARLTKPLQRLAAVGLTLGCATAIAFLAWSESVALTHAQAVSAANVADWEAALGPARDAAAADPDLAPYQVTLGLAAAGNGEWDEAEAAFRTAAALDDLPASWLGLAMAQAELGRPERDVAASLQEALRLGDQQPAITFGAAGIYDRLGLTAQADAAYAMTVAALPSLASDSDWVDDLGSGSRFTSIVTLAREIDPLSAWEVALMAGDVDQALSLASTRPDSGFLGAVIDAWSGDTAALDAVVAVVEQDPTNARALSWAARLSDRRGDVEAAQRYRRLVDLGARGASQGVEVQAGQRVPERDAALGTRTYYYGNYLYRRTTPVDLMVPGLPGLTIADGPSGA
jgi:tetratricopeptide (TPR) repeat protein